MKLGRLSIVTGAICAVVALSHLALADDAACQAIDAVNGKSFSNGVSVNTRINKTGVDFAKDTPKIFSDYSKLICAYVRDEPFKGEPASVYSQRYESSAGITNAYINFDFGECDQSVERRLIFASVDVAGECCLGRGS
jgi:hypothetical protein